MVEDSSDQLSNHYVRPVVEIPKSIFELTNVLWLDLSSKNLSGIVEFGKFRILQNL